VPDLKLPDGAVLRSEADPDTEWDLVIVHTLHPGVDHSWASKSRVLDATYRFDSAAVRAVV
jgi:UDP-N-acetyl-D-glucosamine dehydrogenase